MILVSMFRDCPDAQLARYFSQVATLPAGTKLIAIEGDSADDTRARLAAGLQWFDHQLLVVEHGGPLIGSVELAERYRQCAIVANAGLDATSGDEPVIWIESDLLWKADTLVKLCAQLTSGVDVIAPAIFMGRLFYDVWGYRGLNGQRYTWTLPFHSQLNPSGLTEMSSVGSCVAMRADVARRIRLTETDALVGFCHNARAAGYRVWLDWRLRVNHPPNGVR